MIRSINYSIVRQQLTNQLNHALEEIKTLSGLLPICSYCKKIRDDKEDWIQLEEYISAESDAEFSHGICPERKTKVLKDMDEFNKTRGSG